MITKYDNLDRIFKLYQVDKNQVIIEVKADSPLVVAQFPFVTMQMKYITVTRGKNHVFTTVRDDGSTSSIECGESGHTILTNAMAMFKANVCKFIEENDILIDYCGQSIGEDVYICYNPYYQKWQLRLDDGVHYFNSKANNVNEMIDDCKRFVVADSWIHSCGNLYKPVNAKITLK